ncbi:MAG: NAD(P)H-hydrate epimerase [Planctomycetes bacterium]|nr:NAD(P)H-hydrate epimerase [Planctomycetota bacterium]
MQHLNRKQLQQIDRLATAKYGIPSLLLMENAGRAAAEETIRLIRRKSSRIVVICGKGNNGGDGFVIARHLHNNHYKVSVIYLGDIKDRKSRSAASGEPRLGREATDINLNIVRKLGITIHPLNKSTLRLLKSADIIVDAIFGIGLTREIQGPIKELIAQVNSLNKPVLAVDIPSGLDTNSGQPLGIAVRAKITVTFGYPKIGFNNPETRKYTGKVVVADISLPPI